MNFIRALLHKIRFFFGVISVRNSGGSGKEAAGKHPIQFSRRLAFVVVAGGAASAVGLLGGSAVCKQIRYALNDHDLPFIFEGDEAERIGLAYISSTGASFQELQGSLASRLRSHLALGDSAFDAARSVIQADLTSGNLLVADRWVVSETEALLCAIYTKITSDA